MKNPIFMTFDKQISQVQEELHDARREANSRQAIVKMLVMDAKKFTEANPDNLAALLEANATAQQLARNNAKEAGDVVKALKGKEGTIWEARNKVERAMWEAEDQRDRDAKLKSITDAFSPLWTSAVNDGRPILIATDDSEGLGIWVEDDESDDGFGLVLSTQEEEELRALLNARHDRTQ
jgi:predicted ATP-dependent endonuclease of OLD family